MTDFTKKIQRRIRKSVLQFGIIKTIGRCLTWPLMYLGWRLVEIMPYAKQARFTGNEFDKKYNVDTERDRFSEWAADIESDNWADGTGYDATPPQTVRDSIRELEIVYQHYTAIDLGSGKGRVLLVASEFPFMECLGVEYAPDLHEVAVENIANYRNDERRCQVIRSICADAATFPLPDTPLVLFFAHPFGASVLDGFLRGVQDSLRANPRSIKVIYYDPIDGERFENAGFREIGGRALKRATLIPDILLEPLGWFSIIGFANRRGMEYVIYENS